MAKSRSSKRGTRAGRHTGSAQVKPARGSRAMAKQPVRDGSVVITAKRKGAVPLVKGRRRVAAAAKKYQGPETAQAKKTKLGLHLRGRGRLHDHVTHSGEQVRFFTGSKWWDCTLIDADFVQKVGIVDRAGEYFLVPLQDIKLGAVQRDRWLRLEKKLGAKVTSNPRKVATPAGLPDFYQIKVMYKIKVCDRLYNSALERRLYTTVTKVKKQKHPLVKRVHDVRDR